MHACVCVCVCVHAHARTCTNVYLCPYRQSGRKKKQCWKEETGKQEDIGPEVFGTSSTFHGSVAGAVLNGRDLRH